MVRYLNQWVTDDLGYFGTLISPHVTALTHSLGAVYTQIKRCFLLALIRLLWLNARKPLMDYNQCACNR